MAYELIVTEAAHSDLDEALDYIVHRLSNPTALSACWTKWKPAMGSCETFLCCMRPAGTHGSETGDIERVASATISWSIIRWRRSGRSTFSVFSMAAETMKS